MMNYQLTEDELVFCFNEGEVPRVRDSSSLRTITLSVYFIVHHDQLKFIYPKENYSDNAVG